MNKTVVIDGEVELISVITEDIEITDLIDGDIDEVLIADTHDQYRGEYTFTPSQEEQTVQCEDLLMSQNITINPIPNNYGLITYNGSTITVS